MSILTDEQLIHRCACGDVSAMDVLVSRYHGKLIDFTYRHLQDREASADIAQTTLLRAYQSAGSFQAQASFRSWLYTICLNCIRDQVRRRKVRRESSFDDVELLEESDHTEDQALRQVEDSELWEAIDSLPDGQGSAIILKFRQQMTYEEIAEVLDAPVGTVKSWIYHGLRKLRKLPALSGCED